MLEPHFLLNVFPSNQFSPEEQELFIEHFVRITVKKGDFLLKEGKISSHYWFIETGIARSYAIDVDGNDISTNFYSVGDIVIDWPSFFLRNPTKENIQALTDCVCWQLDFDTFQKLFHSNEAFREQGRTTLVGSYFALKSHSIAMITDPAKDRYKKLLQERPLIAQNVSLKQLATYLGITDTSLSRIRKEIANE